MEFLAIAVGGSVNYLIGYRRCYIETYRSWVYCSQKPVWMELQSRLNLILLMDEILHNLKSLKS